MTYSRTIITIYHTLRNQSFTSLQKLHHPKRYFIGITVMIFSDSSTPALLSCYVKINIQHIPWGIYKYVFINSRFIHIPKDEAPTEIGCIAHAKNHDQGNQNQTFGNSNLSTSNNLKQTCVKSQQQYHKEVVTSQPCKVPSI